MYATYDLDQFYTETDTLSISLQSGVDFPVWQANSGTIPLYHNLPQYLSPKSSWLSEQHTKIKNFLFKK